MFSLREFIKKGLLDAVGKQADYQVIFNATGWLEKGVLNEADLAEINEKIEAQNVPVEIPADDGEDVPAEDTEEVPAETTEEV